MISCEGRRELFRDDTECIHILSFLDGPLEERLCRRIEGQEHLHYQKGELPPDHLLPDVVFDNSFWSRFGIMPDVVLLPVSNDDLDRLSRVIDRKNHLPTTVVAVLLDDSLHGAIRAAQLNFDGILAEPFEFGDVHRLLKGARKKCEKRLFFSQRYHKLRQLLRKTNLDRRTLRNKINLLCQDLVHSNTNLTNTLQSLRKAYDFQNDLTGEFDLNYLLHKSLRHIKEQVDNSSGVIYLCQSKNIEAHISGPWRDEGQRELDEIEQLLKDTIITRVIETKTALLVPKADNWQEITGKERSQLKGLSLSAWPITSDEEMTGVLVIYKDDGQPLTPTNSEAMAIYLPPLAHAIKSVQKLQHLIVH